MQERTNNEAVLFVVGFLFGATVASFFLPKSGEEIRRKIKDSFNQVHDEATGKIKGAAERVRDSSQKVADKVEQMGSKSADKLENISQESEGDTR